MAEMKFEEALKRLEKIVEDLENGELPLDDALKRYEEGIQLSRLCSKKLESAKKKIELVLKSDDGSLKVKPFDEDLADEDAKDLDASKKKGKT